VDRATRREAPEFVEISRRARSRPPCGRRRSGRAGRG
jgi:hypothetical protein